MFGFGYALVPMYKAICDGARHQRAVALRAADRRRARRRPTARSTSRRTVTVEFDANARGPWDFKPAQASIEVHPGELATVMYEFRNRQNRTMAAQAIPSYAPTQAMSHFNKLECFCFNEHTLKPGEIEAVAGGVRHRPEAAEGREDDHPLVHLLRGRRQGAGRAGAGGAARRRRPRPEGAHDERADRRQRPRGGAQRLARAHRAAPSPGRSSACASRATSSTTSPS